MRLVLPLLLTVASLSAADWPQWRGPARDGLVSALAPRAAWPKTLQSGWKMPVGSGHSSPVVVGDRVFVFAREGDEEVVQALALATGKRLWRQGYPAPYAMNSAATSHGKGAQVDAGARGGAALTCARLVSRISSLRSTTGYQLPVPKPIRRFGLAGGVISPRIA